MPRVRRGAKTAQIEDRRSKVAANLLGGLNYRDIASALGVGLATVARDVKIIVERWKSDQVASHAQMVALEMRRLDRALFAIWPRVLGGELEYVEQFRRLSERRAKMMGLDAPASVRYAHMSDEELLEYVRGAIDGTCAGGSGGVGEAQGDSGASETDSEL